MFVQRKNTYLEEAFHKKGTYMKRKPPRSFTLFVGLFAFAFFMGCTATADQNSVINFFEEDMPGLIEDIDWTFNNADFTYLFFSDLHNGWRNLDRMIDVANTVNVDAVINGGDTVLKYLNDPDTDFSWYPTKVQQINADYIVAVGNHDMWDSSYWSKADLVLTYDMILSPVMNHLTNVSQPDKAKAQGLCYYYYDYQNIRIIVLNAMTGDDSVECWDVAQNEWLKKTLDNALKQNQQVICVTHAPFQKDIALRDSALNWNSVDDYRVKVDYDNIHTHMDAVRLVQNYIDNGGTFICWLSGHTHVDEVLEAKGYEGQMMFGIASARYSFHDDGEITDDKEEPWFYCFDLMGIDIQHGQLRRVRLGWNMDNSMKVRNTLCYDYLNGNIVSD